MQQPEVNTLTLDLGKETKSKVKPSGNESPYIGKDILELLTTGMYVNPLVIYREYVQNSVDAIDEALKNGLIDSVDDAEIQILINHAERNILITDNGHGMSNEDFIKTMLSVGDSKKRTTDARGMRGVGRLSGLAYAQKIIFRSCTKNDKDIMEAEWDCKMMRKLLKEDNELDLSMLLDEVVSFHKKKKTLEQPHFFEVEIQKPIRMKWDLLMNEKKIQDYLGQVAPVPFSPDFSFKKEIEEQFSTQINDEFNYNIFIKLPNLSGNEDTSDEYISKQIFKPYADHFTLRQDVQDSVHSVEFIKLNSNDGGIAAIGWILHSSYMGAIPKNQHINGIRARSGNIMIGEPSIFLENFTEARFSNWCIGEIHIIDERVKPNARRDNFEESVHTENINSQISLIANDIASRCRANSSFRNSLKNIASRINKATELTEIIKQNFLSKQTNKDYLIQAKTLIKESHKYTESLSNQLENPLLTSNLENEFNKIQKKLKDTEKEISIVISELDEESFEIKGVISKVKLNAYREIFDLIIDTHGDKRNASLLIEKIIKKIESKNQLH